MCYKIGNLIYTLVVHSEVTRCVICILNIVEYLDHEQSYKNFARGIIMNICYTIKKILDNTLCHERFKKLVEFSLLVLIKAVCLYNYTRAMI